MGLKLSALGLLLITLPIASNASIVYDNFGPNDDHSTGIRWTIDWEFTQGFQFAPTASGVFTSLDVGMGVSGTPPETVRFDLYADASDTLGALLESVDVIVNNNTTTLGISTGLASGSTNLVAGQMYWLIATSLSGVNVPWGQNSTGDSGLHWVNGSVYEEPDTKGAFRVNASVVPIPAAVWLFGSGLLGLVGMARRKKA